MSGLLLVLLIWTSNAFATPEGIGDFGLIDHKGVFHQVSRYAHKKALVLIPQANGCDTTTVDLARYQALRQAWQEKGVEFFMINSTGQDSRAAISGETDVYEIDFPVLIDRAQLVAESLNIGEVGEILIVEPTHMKLLFKGPLDQQQGSRDEEPKPTPLADTLARAVAGEAESMDTVRIAPVDPDRIDAQACKLMVSQHVSLPAQAPDYATRVAPILQQNCIECHREGGIAPFAMSSYLMVQGWSPMMRETIMTKRMPPMQVDPEIGHFSNARYLSDQDLQTLVHWIDAGSPRGDGEDPLRSNPKNPDFDTVGWDLGEPDYIVEVPAQDVPATGVLDYRNVMLELPFVEGKWIKSIQFRPSEKAVLHHLLSYIVPADYDSETDRSKRPQRRFLEGYAPGKTTAQIFPNNAGVFIPNGHKIRVQLHYTPFGKAVTDKTRIGLYFHDEVPDYEFHNKSVVQGNLAIPAGAHEYKASQQFVFEKDIMLYGLRPHMHYRGKHFKFRVVYPNNTTEELLSVARYDFAWQPTYRLSTPKLLPAGSRVMISGAFDNSEQNPGNPDPSKDIEWGAQSWDEMFIGYFAYHYVDKDDDVKRSNSFAKPSPKPPAVTTRSF